MGARKIGLIQKKKKKKKKKNRTLLDLLKKPPPKTIDKDIICGVFYLT
jgi:hypothetical protein